MTAARSFARTWTGECLHCHQTFTQVGKRGRLRQTCSDFCRDERLKFTKVTLRNERYRQLVAAGACFQVARDGSQGSRKFEAVLEMLRELPPEQRSLSVQRVKPTGVKAAPVKSKPAPTHPWRERRWRAA